MCGWKNTNEMCSLPLLHPPPSSQIALASLSMRCSRFCYDLKGLNKTLSCKLELPPHYILLPLWNLHDNNMQCAAASDGTLGLINIYSEASQGPPSCVLMNKTRCLSFLFNVKSPWTVAGTKRIFTRFGTPGSWIICWRLCSFLKLPRVTCSGESVLIYSPLLWV